MFDSIGSSRTVLSRYRIVWAVIVLAVIAGAVWIWRIAQMPLRSFAGPLPALSRSQKELEDRLSIHVSYLAETIGERNLSRPQALRAAAEYLNLTLEQAGYTVSPRCFSVQNDRQVCNLEVRLPGNDLGGETVIVGAHYDSARGTPGANDNASGVAALLELARLLHDSKPRKTLRLVFFVDEEPPFFQTDTMGSLVYARQLQTEDVRVSAMIALETIGFYSDAPGSQRLPALLSVFYPSRGNFVGFVGNWESRGLVRRTIRKFRESSNFPSQGIAAPADCPGTGWSDHWSFWQEGLPAIMITDTALFRYPHYHKSSDTPDKLDFGKMARVVDGVRVVVESLASE